MFGGQTDLAFGLSSWLCVHEDCMLNSDSHPQLTGKRKGAFRKANEKNQFNVKFEYIFKEIFSFILLCNHMCFWRRNIPADWILTTLLMCFGGMYSKGQHKMGLQERQITIVCAFKCSEEATLETFPAELVLRAFQNWTPECYSIALRTNVCRGNWSFSFLSADKASRRWQRC